MFQDPGQLAAHPVLLIALPAFIPAIVLIAAIIYIARKDRKEERLELEQELAAAATTNTTRQKEDL